jgi:hypothetical protein
MFTALDDVLDEIEDTSHQLPEILRRGPPLQESFGRYYGGRLRDRVLE